MAEPTTPANHRHEDKSAHQPVMDVTPPKPAEQSKLPPQESQDGPHPAPAFHDAEPAPLPAPQPAPAKPVKQPRSGVALAVVATVIVILGLGALFVYAYLRTNNISIF